MSCSPFAPFGYAARWVLRDQRGVQDPPTATTLQGRANHRLQLNYFAGASRREHKLLGGYVMGYIRAYIWHYEIGG